MLITEFVLINITYRNKNYYKNLGYDCDIGEKITVKVNDLPKNSKTRVKIRCDYCGDIIERQWINHIKQIKENIINKDACIRCAGQKRKESNMLIYGVENVMYLDNVKNKIKETFQRKYGASHPMYLEETKNKIKQTCLNKYGVDWITKDINIRQSIIETNLKKYGKKCYTQTEEYKTKTMNTNFKKYGTINVFKNKKIQIKQRNTILKKYGVENVFQNDDIKNKIREVVLGKYGVEHPMKCDIIKTKVRKKVAETIYNNNLFVSKPQQYIYSIIGGELNYPVDKLNLDIAFPESKIYIEYNGGGHDLAVKIGRITEKEFIMNEIRRYKFLKSLGWKQILIVSPRDYLPQKDILLKEIKKAIRELNNGKWHYKIIINDSNYDEKYGFLQKYFKTT